MRSRLTRELKMLADDPPPGVAAWPVGDSMVHLHADITGPPDSPYAEGVFRLEVRVSERYPFEPPKCRFVTPIFHPNIDDGGRICLDALKMRPQGSWTPSINIPTLLTSIRLLIGVANPDDGLMPDITQLFREDPAGFAERAKAHTRRHATGAACSAAAAADGGGGGGDGAAAATAAAVETGAAAAPAAAAAAAAPAEKRAAAGAPAEEQAPGKRAKSGEG